MRYLLAALIAVFSLVSVMPMGAVAADDGSSGDIKASEKKLEEVQERLSREKKSIDVIAKKERSILGDIEDASRAIVKSRAELKRIDARLKKIRAETAETAGRIEKLDKERSRLSERLTGRLAAMYRMRRGEAVKVMFSSDTSADAARRHKYLTVIMEDDSRLIADYEAKITELEGERTRLASLGERMEVSRKESAEARRRAEADRGRKRDLLSGIQRRKDEKAALITELEGAAEELANILKDLRGSDDIITDGSGFSNMRGRLRMPVSGRIISRYGRVTHPKFKTVTFNNGIVIDAKLGEPVRSVYGGRVVYTGWLKGYGQILIVDNGGGYYTLFAYLSKILVERGSMVERGAEIALVGDTGPSPDAGLYFEIRRRGVPKDPVPWFTASR